MTPAPAALSQWMVCTGKTLTVPRWKIPSLVLPGRTLTRHCERVSFVPQPQLREKSWLQRPLRLATTDAWQNPTGTVFDASFGCRAPAQGGHLSGTEEPNETANNRGFSAS